MTLLSTKDGKNYKLNANGTVKNLDPFAKLKDILKEADLNAGSQLKAIYHYLLDNGEEVTQNKGWLNCRGYRMGFEEHGFIIRDMKNYGELEDWDEPFPTPREVLEFLLKPKSLKKKKTIDLKKSSKGIIALREVEVDPLAEEFEKSNFGKKAVWLNKETKAFIDWKKNKDKPEEEIEEKEGTLEYLEELRKKAIRYVKATKKIQNLIEKMQTFFPHRGFNVYFGKLLRKYENKKIRSNSFKKELLQLIETIDFTPKKKPAPKFLGLGWYKIASLTEDGDTINFKDKNIGNLSFHKTQFLIRFLLHIEPKAMVQLMGYLNGDITLQQFIDNPIKKDRFVAYNDKAIRTCTDLKLYEAIENILFDWEEYNPLYVAYGNNVSDLIVGEDLFVYWLDNGGRYTATVVTLEEGIQLRYEDGEVLPLLKHQRWTKR